MNTLRGLGLGLLLVGAGLLAYAAATGQAHVALFLIFPVIYGSGGLSFLAMLLLMSGVLALFASFAVAPPARATRHPPEAEYDYDPEHVIVRPRDPTRAGEAEVPGWEEPRRERRVKSGGVVLIGPFPIVWGSDRGMVKGLVLLVIILMVLALLFMWAAPRTAGF